MIFHAARSGELQMCLSIMCRIQLKCDGTRWRTGGEVKGNLPNAVCSKYSSHYLGNCYTQDYGRWCAQLGCQQLTVLTYPADLNVLVRFAKTRNLFSTNVPSHFKRSLPNMNIFVTEFYVLVALDMRRKLWRHDELHSAQTSNFLTYTGLYRERIRQVFLLLNLLWLSVLNCNHMYKRPKCIVIFRHIYSMVQSSSWEACWFEACEEISRNPKAHYRTHKRPPPVSILHQPNEVFKTTSHLDIHPSIIHQSTPRSPQWSPSLQFPYQYPIQETLLTHTRHMPNPSHSSPFYHPHNIVWAVQIIAFPVIYPNAPLQTSLFKGLHPCRRKGSDRRHVALCCWYSSG